MSKDILGESPIPTEDFITGNQLAEGVVVEIIAKPEARPQKEDTPDLYKTGAGNGLVKAGIIKEGETMWYRVMMDGQEYVIDNSSYQFYKSLMRLHPSADQKFTIKREGESTSTRYVMNFVEEQEA